MDLLPLTVEEGFEGAFEAGFFFMNFEGFFKGMDLDHGFEKTNLRVR